MTVRQPAAQSTAADASNIPQPLSDESRILVQLAGGLALIFKFDPGDPGRRTIRPIHLVCERFGFPLAWDTVCKWVRVAAAYARAPERPLQFPTKAKGTFPTKVKGTLRKLIQSMIADHYTFDWPLADDVLLEIQNDLGGVGVSMNLADIRKATVEIHDELGKPEIVD